MLIVKQGLNTKLPCYQYSVNVYRTAIIKIKIYEIKMYEIS